MHTHIHVHGHMGEREKRREGEKERGRGKGEEVWRGIQRSRNNKKISRFYQKNERIRNNKHKHIIISVIGNEDSLFLQYQNVN